MSEQNGTPQFDFSNLSWGDDKLGSRLPLMLRKASEENDAELMEQAQAGMDGYLAKVTTYVPREWLIATAPDSIDWSNPDSFNYVRANKIAALRDEMIKAKQGN